MSRVFQINKSYPIRICTLHFWRKHCVLVDKTPNSLTNRGKKAVDVSGPPERIGTKEENIYCLQKSNSSSQKFPQSEPRLLRKKTLCIGRQDAKFTKKSRKESGGCPRAAGMYWNLGTKGKSIYCVQKSKSSSQNFPHTNLWLQMN